MARRWSNIHVANVQVTVDHVKLSAASRKRAASEMTRGASEPVPEKPVIPDALKILPGDSEVQKKAKRARIKAIKSTHRFKKMDDQTQTKKSSWQAFQSNAIQKGALKKESMFRSPDTVDGRVGVVGSGQGMTEYSKVYLGKKVQSSTPT